MALDLFVNYERTENSSVFYRLTSVSPFTHSFRLSDLTAPLSANYSTIYVAQSSLNAGPFLNLSTNSNGWFVSPSLQWNVTTPCVCSISVSLSSISPSKFIKTFTLSGVFVNQIPAADFVAYPEYIVYKDPLDNAIKAKTLNASNFYTETSGVFFYGEGHSEKISLSSNCENSNKALWYIGNSLSSIQSQETSVWSITGTTNNSQASTLIASVINEEHLIPISLKITNGTITSSSPIFTYKDSDGSAEFYPYFTSSLNVSGGINANNTLVKNNIEVKTYPVSPILFPNPFALSSLFLPLDYSNKTFSMLLSVFSEPTLLEETFVGTQWSLSAQTESDLSWEVPTVFLKKVNGYQFELGYYTNEIAGLFPPFKASPFFPTTVTVVASAQKIAQLKPLYGPTDWPETTETEVRHFDTLIQPIPSAKIYFPNYFIEQNSRAEIHAIPIAEPPYEIQTITLSSLYSPEVLTLSSTSLSGTMLFDQLGFVDITAKFTLKNTETNLTVNTEILFQNIIEVIDTYDDLQGTEYYQTLLTPLTLTYDEQPKIVPNEWAIADNINSVIKKFYQILSELDARTKLYQQRFKFNSFIGTSLSELQTIYVWQDLECVEDSSFVEEDYTWANFECDPLDAPTSSKQWQYHECTIEKDPTCLQKYCLHWTWYARKKANAELDLTWKDTKSNENFAKKWRFERCENSNVSVNCGRGFWKTEFYEPDSFPINSCTFQKRCNIVDVEHLEAINCIALAYPTEINLASNDYFTTNRDTESRIGNLFAFQNIVGLTSNSEGKILVLDNVLSKVVIFRVINNNLVYFNSWGSFGLQSTKIGFNEPQDIHIDQNNSVWIADTGNNCVKKYTINGYHLATITNEQFENNSPKSVCVDSQSNVHVLIEGKVIVFDSQNNYSFEYSLPNNVKNVSKINTNYKRELVYITYETGVVKYFRTGTIYGYLFKNELCLSGEVLTGYNSITQDKYRNVYITVNDKLFKVPDLMKIFETKAPLNPDLYWNLEELLIHKEEYIQPWVYLKAFHRLWDNIELLRNSLFYDSDGTKTYTSPIYDKQDLIIGQNEIVANAVINRLSSQLWTNLQSLFEYFKPTS